MQIFPLQLRVPPMTYGDMPVIIPLLATGYLLTIYLLLILAQRTPKKPPQVLSPKVVTPFPSLQETLSFPLETPNYGNRATTYHPPEEECSEIRSPSSQIGLFE